MVPLIGAQQQNYSSVVSQIMQNFRKILNEKKSSENVLFSVCDLWCIGKWQNWKLSMAVFWNPSKNYFVEDWKLGFCKGVIPY